jgi:hypothetical protein
MERHVCNDVSLVFFPEQIAAGSDFSLHPSRRCFLPLAFNNLQIAYAGFFTLFALWR